MNRIPFLIPLFVLAIHFTAADLCAQAIVNIESRRLEADTSGWEGSARLGFHLNKNVRSQLSLYTSAHVQHNAGPNLYLLVGNMSLVEAGDDQFVNDGFLHFRYNHKIDRRLLWEAFTQLQYNKVLDVEERFLLGTGPRFTLSDSKKLKLHFGPLYMFESERTTGTGKAQQNHRMSVYLSTAWQIGSTALLSSTIYYQPFLDNLSDYRLSGQAELNVQISKRLSFTTEFHYLFDQDPAAAIPKEVYSMKNGLEFSF